MKIWTRKLLRLMLGTLVVGLLSGTTRGQPIEIAGWVESDPTTQVIPLAAFRLLRGGSWIDYPRSGLLACDKLVLVDEKATVRVRLVSNLRMQLDAHSPEREIVVPCNQRGVAADLATALRAFIGGAEQRTARVAALTRDVPPLLVPALMPPIAMIVAGRRSIYLAWTGGEGPFSVQVVRASDGREVVLQTDVTGRALTLPPTDFVPGTYTLWVRNRNGHRAEGFRQDALVATSQDLPEMPEILKNPSLAEESRTLFYADFLSSQDDGRWTLEALQLVRSLPADLPAVRQWLFRYGVRD